MSHGTVQRLLGFARALAEATTQAEIYALLPDALVELTGADAAAVLRISDDEQMQIAGARGLPARLAEWSADADTIGAELGTDLRAACGGAFAEAQVQALASSGGLFGAFVLLYRHARPNAEQMELAHSLADLTATALGEAARVEELRGAYGELRSSQQALQRTEKLRGLGQMAAGIAHDFKNILQPLSLHLQLAKRALAKDDAETAVNGIDEAMAVVRRGVETVERLREFSRQEPEAKLAPVDLDRLLHEAASIAKPRMTSRGGRLNVINEELGAPPPVLARAGELVSALVNLIVNAIDAMPNGGTITLRTRAENGAAIVEVADDGPGMSPEVQARVFEPFFTTKGDAGTGLGLAMVYACMQRHGGTVTLESAVGKGTTFRLSFPFARG